MTRKIWGWAERALVLAALLSLLFFGVLEFWFFKTAPTNPSLIAIHAIKWRGTTGYLTAAQQLETDTLFWGGAVLLLVAIVLNLWIKWSRN
ncbi:MAG: hypothetical protein ACLQDM_27395 [Bradyrhizobium sp.]